MCARATDGMVQSLIARLWRLAFALAILDSGEKRIRRQFRQTRVEWTVSRHTDLSATLRSRVSRVRLVAQLACVDATHIICTTNASGKHRPGQPHSEGLSSTQGRKIHCHRCDDLPTTCLVNDRLVRHG